MHPPLPAYVEHGRAAALSDLIEALDFNVACGSSRRWGATSCHDGGVGWPGERAFAWQIATRNGRARRARYTEEA